MSDVCKLLPVVILGAVLWGCSDVTSKMASSWEQRNRDLLPMGYSDFRAHHSDPDTAAGICSFAIPAQLTADGLFRHLKQVHPQYQVTSQTSETLVLRKMNHQTDFIEVRCIYVPAVKRAYVLRAWIDSPAEATIAHPNLVKRLESIAGDPASPQNRGVASRR